MIKNVFKLLTIGLVLINSSCKAPYPDLGDGLYAEFVTSKDTMVAKLFFKKTPVTVASFVALAEGEHPLIDEKYKGKRFYDSTTFHRVMDGFMIQGGDPTATGSGDAGFKFEDEFISELKHSKPGILSMANSGPNTNGSQFFITERATPHLDAYLEDGTLKKCGPFPGGSCHTVFGELVKGLDVQDSISNVKVGAGNKPIEDVIISEVNIIRKGKEAKKFNAPKVFNSELPKVKERVAKAKEEAEKKAEEAKRLREETIKKASEEFKPKLDNYIAKSKATPSGLKKYILTPSKGIKPKIGQEVMVYYEGYLTDGKLFDSNRKNIEEKFGMLNPVKNRRNLYNPVKMKISPDARLIAGFKEALATMKVGEKAFFYLPSHIAYGERGSQPVIAPNTDITFIIEIVELVN